MLQEFWVKHKNILLYGFFTALVVVFAASAIYFWRQARELKQNPQRAAQGEVAEIVERVGRLMVLPEGETPTVATVTDPERLRGQPFFENAKLGDRVLIYTNARKAILYRSPEHKIVEVAPLNIEGGPAVPPPASPR